jgi:glycerophosphoryl diester phosphodiesterase
VKVIGHRGWPTRYPDNAIEGIAAAFGVADMVEVDVRRTADDRLVLSHDPLLSGLVVSDTPWEHLAALDLGTGRSPVLVPDLLLRFPGSRFNLEVKNWPGEPGFDPDHRIGTETAALARAGDLLSCFFWPTMDAIHDDFPGVATGLLIDSDGDLVRAVDHALAGGHLAIVMQWELALRSGAICRVAADAGLTLIVWTLNDPAHVDELATLGVSAIITDDPGLMRRAVG